MNTTSDAAEAGKKYDHRAIEKKWQDIWEKDQIYKTQENSSKPKQYILDMFPYPSGEGLHVGHPRGYLATDVYGRKKRMQGYNVLHPMGWDAFGLPAENFAIKNKVHPSVVVQKNVHNFKEQLSLMGVDYDWSREINTTDPAFYTWTQWIFLQMYHKGLAYESWEPINWCPSCQTGLANEDIEANGTCEVCGTLVEKKPIRQWVLRITDYADRLLSDLDMLPKWPNGVKEAQRHWIGKSEGSEITFALKNTNEKIVVFTTRADTLFGVTYIVLAPEHALVETLRSEIINLDEVEQYIRSIKDQSDIDRTNTKKEKTGVQLKGITAINHANNEELPVWIADYVLGGYGTGAVMAVPAHDERDFAFAKKYDLPIKEVVEPLVIKNTGEDAFKTSASVVERNAVVAIIKHWSEEKYLGVEWKKTGWKGFIIGGIEEGESAIDAGMREIVEESGYKNVEYVKELGGTIHAKFYQLLKQQNRFAHFTPIFFTLKNGEKIETNEEEKAIHEFNWLSKEEMQSFITHPDMHIAWQRVWSTNSFTEYGILANSDQFNGLSSEMAKEKIVSYVGGKIKSTYKIKDWVFSRQRYWGEPIPIIHCEKCGVVPVPEKDLPVLLPEVESYAPTGTGESPLADRESWVNVPCPQCASAAKRETNTMPQWAGSSWYYLRYIDPHNTDAIIDPTKEKSWMPVDVYVGGDHATRHLIYARFWHKFLFDIGVVSTEEPFPRLEFLGFILASDGKKFSKRAKNGVNPSEVIAQFGADAFRLYEMFIGPFESTAPWNTNGLVGTYRFIEKVWNVAQSIGKEKTDDAVTSLLHKTIQKVTSDIEQFKFNTAVSALMICINEVAKKEISQKDFKTLLQLLAPFAPHIAEELWHSLGESHSVHLSAWPVYDASLIIEDTVTIGVQINGKLRGELAIQKDDTEDTIKASALALSKIKEYVGNNSIKKVIVIPNRIINIVI